MTPHAQRLQRLLHLRKQMHLAVELDLRVAHNALRAEEAGLEQVRAASRQARNLQRTVPFEPASGDWLLSYADAEFYELGAAAYVLRVAAAAAAVRDAAAAERDARRERRQMEVTLADVQREAARDAERAEQQQMDESSRHLLAVSHPAWKPLQKPV